MARTGRQLKLIEIINKNEIETQEALAEALRNEGYLVTQATVSRYKGFGTHQSYDSQQDL